MNSFRSIRSSLAPFVVLAGFAVAGAADAQTTNIPQLDPEYLEAVKKEATALGRSMQGMPSLDVSGNVVRNPDGSIAVGPISSATSAGATALMQEMTGISGYEALGEPASKSGIAGARAQINGSVDFACGLSAGGSRYASGQTFKFGGCEIDSGRVARISLSLCTKTESEPCTAEDFTEPKWFDANAYDRLGTLEIGVGCNDAIRSCRVTFSSEFSFKAKGEELSQRAAEIQGAAAMRGTLANVVQSDEYLAQVAEQESNRDCYDENLSSYENSGTVSSCDKKKTTVLSGGNDGTGGTCLPQRSCIKEATTTRTFNTTCTRTWSMTANQCKVTTPTRACTVTVNKVTGEESSSCSPEDLTGGTEVGRTEQICVAWGEPAPDGVAGACTKASYEVSWAFLDQEEVTECSANPYPLAGAFGPQTCDMSTGTRELDLCGADDWFGRTLSEAQCTEMVEGDDGSSLYRPLDYRTKAGCGICSKAAKVSYACRAAQTFEDLAGSCAQTNLSGCSLTSASVIGEANGLVLSQEENYSCSQTSSQCTEWKVENSCVNVDASFGVSDMPVYELGEQGSFESAMALAGIADGMSASSSAGDGAAELFGGEDTRCEYPVGLAGIVMNDCCRIGLTKSGNKLLNRCSDDEIRLAAARRAKQVVYIGSYCSKSSLFGCVKRKQTYCTFPGLLPRIVQTEGREQIQDIARAGLGSAIKTEKLAFSFYEGAGGWTAPSNVNGQEVVAWQQPAYCSDAKTAGAALAENPELTSCPASLGLTMAVCSDPGKCGELPRVPEEGSEKWQLTVVDPLKVTQTALSRFVLAKGGCDTAFGQCQFDVSAWPAGAGGRSVVSRNLVLEVASSQGAGDPTHSVMLGDALVRVEPRSTGQIGTLPAVLNAAISRDAGATWQSFQLPTQIPDLFDVPNSGITVSGGCTAASGLCEYRLSGMVAIEAKPWGTARAPDCSGFNLDQLSILDFSAMDLSEWTATVQAEIPPGQVLADQAQSQAQAGNRFTSTRPTQARTAVINPGQEIGPFVARLTLSGNWPEMHEDPALNTDPIYSARVDWGDCTPQTALIRVPSGGFFAEHTYKSPDAPGMCDRSGAGGTGRTLRHNVKVTIDAKSGVHTLDMEVVNAWDDYVRTNPGGGNVSPSVPGTPPGP